jgi:isochorismate synthase EntC
LHTCDACYGSGRTFWALSTSRSALIRRLGDGLALFAGAGIVTLFAAL